ncbi:hypothetical protein EVAR_38512_1 [Eumeta japonica]|uniref:Histone-lysine N-methyltransferase SETMAR n=1 Tax=Eumeta variegata TaxID=151549 RepID=A0A4C1WCB2_EUMVA|nr:hypothetical protein EVAR_38512_1 [Eumeta japonica]
MNEFKRGRTDPTDDLLEERPSTTTTEDNANAVRLKIETDQRVTYQQIRKNLGIDMSQVHQIPHEHLASWVMYHMNTRKEERIFNPGPRCGEGTEAGMKTGGDVTHIRGN